MTATNFHINSRPICVQCNAEMEPYEAGVTPLPDGSVWTQEDTMKLMSQHDTFTSPSGGRS